MDLVDFWSTVPMQFWPQGLRTEENRLPGPSDRNEYIRPLGTDVQAVRILSETQPHRIHSDGSTRAARGKYTYHFTNLFSVPGLYRFIIQEAGFPIGNRVREAFPFDTRNLSPFIVAGWLHDHGLDPKDPVIGYIEDWGQRSRAQFEPHDHGKWPSFPNDLDAFREHHALAIPDVRIAFQYPPRVPSSAERDWLTAAETFVNSERQRLRSLPPIAIPGACEQDEETEPEEEEIEVDKKDESTSIAPTTGGSGPDPTAPV
jgi:hypothetical protein